MANIELDGPNKKIKVDSGDLTLDVPGDIILDADGADVVFADGGTNILKVTNSSSDVVFQPQVDAKDIIFKQYDGTTVATVEDNGTFNIPTDKLAINGTAVTSTAAELNILDGVTATATELNLIDGVTATTAELNILDGVTATAAEINLIDGGTARGTTAIADGDGVLINDAGTMRMTSVETLKTYMGGSPLVVLGTITVSNVATGNFTFDNIFSSTYDHYIITGFAAPSNSNEALQFQFRTGSSGSNATLENVYCFIVNHARIDNNDATGSDIAGEYNATAAKISNHGVAVDGSTKFTSFDMFLSDPNTNHLGRSNWHGNCTYQNPTNDRHFNGTFGGSTTSNPNATGITFSYSANNIQYGRITIYGVKHA